MDSAFLFLDFEWVFLDSIFESNGFVKIHPDLDFCGGLYHAFLVLGI